MQQFTQEYYAAVLVTSIVAQVANAVEIIYLRKKTKTVFICLLLSLCLADMFTSFAWSVYISLYLLQIHITSLIMILLVPTIASSLLHITAIAIDRYFSAFYPILHLVRMNTIKVKILLILAVWSTPIATAMGVLAKIASGSFPEITDIFLMFLGIFIIVTRALLVGFYAMIIKKIFMLSKARRKLEANKTQAGANRYEKATVVKCFVVTLTFFAFTYPFAIGLIQKKHSPNLFTAVLLVLNSLVNPLAYFFTDYTRRCCRNTN